MRSRVLSARGLSRAALVLALSLPFAAPLPRVSADDTSLSDEVERLRAEMERVFLDARRDHARVRSSAWSESVLEDEFAAALEAVVLETRDRPRQRTLREAASAAEDAARSLGTRRVVVPLSCASLQIVLADAL